MPASPSIGRKCFQEIAALGLLRTIQKLIDSAHEFVSIRSNFVDTLARHIFQHSLAPRQQRHQHASAIVAAPRPSHVPACFHSIHKFDDAVMLQRQTLRQSPDGGFLAAGKPANHQQQQILLGFKASPACGSVALAQEMTDAIAKLGQRPELFGGDFGAHKLSIS
jgi:hypothetical protein